ncbi:MAG: histidine--tRNA ligase [Nitrospinae bacterium]|nr:histidine--tRNA ligase [Nitrospinota bacterium]
MLKDKKTALQGVRGAKDITPEDAPFHRMVEDAALDVFSLYGFQEIKTPIFEKTEVFSRGIGETSDIVEKEMYTFSDRGGESLTLRPEGTAAVVRAYIEHKLYEPPGVTRLFYTGPMFRAERPQAGRFRQFHQVGAEIFGASGPDADAEIIAALMDFFTELGVTDLKVVLNSLGCADCRPAYREALLAYLRSHAHLLCENCVARLERNPLRVLDCKSERCRAVAADAPMIDKHRCDPCQAHLEGVRRPLRKMELPVVLDPRLVRGLDYYSRTAFEVTSNNLGAQNAVAGGGRYDSLVEQFGGPPTPAIGFAVGVERLITLLGEEARAQAQEIYGMRPDLYLIAMSEGAEETVFELAHRLRGEKYVVDRGFGFGSLKNQLKRADRSGAALAVIVGDDEVAKGEVTIKTLSSGEQKKVSLTEIHSAIEDALEESY